MKDSDTPTLFSDVEEESVDGDNRGYIYAHMTESEIDSLVDARYKRLLKAGYYSD